MIMSLYQEQIGQDSNMIKYDRLWETMKKRHISQYDLYTYYGVTRSLLNRFRKNQNVEIYTLDRICTILDCNIEDIVEHVPDEPKNTDTSGNGARKLPDMRSQKKNDTVK